MEKGTRDIQLTTGFDEDLGSFNWLGSDDSGWFLCPQKTSRNSTVYR
jgi:hypothetical protein